MIIFQAITNGDNFSVMRESFRKLKKENGKFAFFSKLKRIIQKLRSNNKIVRKNYKIIGDFIFKKNLKGSSRPVILKDAADE